MPAAPADSLLYRDLFGDPETSALFTEAAEIRAMLVIEGALARVQGRLGLIPGIAAGAIDRAAQEVEIDPASLSAETAINGVPIPALLTAFRSALGSPEHAQYVHWGATSQDIVDSALALRLKQLTDIWDEKLRQLIMALGQLASTHADLPMAARTYGQIATPTSFGAVVANWGRPLLRHRARLENVRTEITVVSLGGASGTLSAMGSSGPAVRAALAEALDLHDPSYSWHTERDSIAAFCAWMVGLCASLGKIGEDLILMAQSGIDEIKICGAGGSSTMPQKQNPVSPSVLVALARQTNALSAGLQGAAMHRQQRDGAAWFTEWLILPQLCISTGRSLALACDVASRITPDPAAMARGLDDGSGKIYAEALTFALARHLPRTVAQAKIEALCKEAKPGGPSILALLTTEFPSFDLTSGESLGTAPYDARVFATQADQSNVT